MTVVENLARSPPEHRETNAIIEDGAHVDTFEELGKVLVSWRPRHETPEGVRALSQTNSLSSPRITSTLATARMKVGSSTPFISCEFSFLSTRAAGIVRLYDPRSL